MTPSEKEGDPPQPSLLREGVRSDATFYSDGGAESGQHGDKDLNHQSYDFLLSHRLKSLEYPTSNPSFINHP